MDFSSEPSRSNSHEREPLLSKASRMHDSLETKNAIADDVISKHATVEVDAAKRKEIKENLHKYEQLFGADEDAFVQPTTTRKELWAYYLYYNVCRGIFETFNLLTTGFLG
jgi:hypothetical protein